ncbi:hypothetical protein FRC04_003291 [Tulasnella sp. 424]|nr:hypothetical protein FRC04_003291 [Tulasnella sp. 424]KAG8977485.1 hypothetical protein FRC05_001343 [Tulasnella sp. 425]
MDANLPQADPSGQQTPQAPEPTTSNPLVEAFRSRYYNLEHRVQQTIHESFGDTTVIERLGDELDEFSRTFQQHSGIFSPVEADTFRTNVALLQQEVGQAYHASLDASHHGMPEVVRVERTGRPGRPRIVIEPSFLERAVAYRGSSKIAKFLKLGRTKVRDSLLEYGLVQAGRNPFPNQGESTQELPHNTYGVNALTDAELDAAIVQLRTNFPNAGLTMLDGMLRRNGNPTSRPRISASLVHIDPVRRVFERVRIKRRRYQVPGPNALWHHDGQHGLIRWGIVIHGFIDGHTRMVVGIAAANNNFGSTVLNLFLRAAHQYGVPSRLRGDHGTENIQVAAYMEMRNGVQRGSYIWGRSVHNVRIERLWVDVTVQFGSKWHSFFENLEVQHGLNINNRNHLWLLHYLYLPDINADCAFFAESWNHHRIQTPGQPARSPHDMWFFDQFTNGVRGDQLTLAELEEFGVDWEGLREAQVLSSWQGNNSAEEGTTSWVGRAGPPADLSDVPVHPPGMESLTVGDIADVHAYVLPFLNVYDFDSLTTRWTNALAFARTRSGNF